MLDNARVATRLPVQNLDRARTFYSEKLGLEPTEERPGGLLYRFAHGEFALYRSAGTAAGTFTQMAFEVDDHDALVAELKRRGVVFEDVDVPGLRTTEGSPKSRATIRARAVRESAPPGFATAKATCWAWDSRSTNPAQRHAATRGVASASVGSVPLMYVTRKRLPLEAGR